MRFVNQVLAGITFYTCLPLQIPWKLEFQSVARMAPWMGLLIGGLLGLLDGLLQLLGMPQWTRSALVVASWVAVTGGLHLDGAMDAADGLAVTEPQRRLQVMSDSVTGAFGAMAAVIVLLLKSVALSELISDRLWILVLVAGWGRWGQLLAIVQYPYLKATGKGSFHREAVNSLWETIPAFVVLIGLSGLGQPRLELAIAMAVGGATISILTGAWFHWRLGGHTGDTYGATVEWTETILLCLLTIFQ